MNALLFEPEETYSRAPAGDTPSWFTPLPWWLALEQRLINAGLLPGRFTCDPCAHLEAPVSQQIAHRGGRIWTEDQDGLRRSWNAETVWANPPYDSATAERWASACVERAPRCRGLVLHVPAWSDRAWWQDHLEQPRRRGELTLWLEPGRLRYGWPGNPAGVGGDGAKFPSAVLIWRMPAAHFLAVR